MHSTPRSFSFEFKLDVVRRFLDGEATAAELAREHGLSSPDLVKTWARKYRNEGEDALRPKRRGRPPGQAGRPEHELSEVEQLRRENLRLAAENAYLKKLRALRAQGRG
jgi:transposase